MDRDIILIKGAPGSRSESLSQKLANEHYSQLFVEHIPINAIMRSLGRIAIATPDKDMYDIVSHTLTHYDSAGLILMTDYPQNMNQIDDLYELAMLDGRNLSGMIIADTPKADAIKRIKDEHHPPLTADDTEMVLLDYYKRHDPIILELYYRGLPLQFIDTAQPEEEIIHNGVHSIKYLLARDDIEERHAS